MTVQRRKKAVDCSPANERRLQKHAIGLAELLLDYAAKGERFPLAPTLRGVLDYYLNQTGFAARAAGKQLGYRLAIIANRVVADGHVDSEAVRAELKLLGAADRLDEIRAALKAGSRGPKADPSTVAWRIYTTLAAETNALPRADENRRAGQAEFMRHVDRIFGTGRQNPIQKKRAR